MLSLVSASPLAFRAPLSKISMVATPGSEAAKSNAEVYRYREAELTHGRVGMLAAAGFLVQENFHPLFDGVGGPAINQIPQLPPALWFLMTLGIGICETL